jgi:hypothetical protein
VYSVSSPSGSVVSVATLSCRLSVTISLRELESCLVSPDSQSSLIFPRLYIIRSLGKFPGFSLKGSRFHCPERASCWLVLVSDIDVRILTYLNRLKHRRSNYERSEDLTTNILHPIKQRES